MTAITVYGVQSAARRENARQQRYHGTRQLGPVNNASCVSESVELKKQTYRLGLHDEVLLLNVTSVHIQTLNINMNIFYIRLYKAYCITYWRHKWYNGGLWLQSLHHGDKTLNCRHGNRHWHSIFNGFMAVQTQLDRFQRPETHLESFFFLQSPFAFRETRLHAQKASGNNLVLLASDCSLP